MYFWTNIRIIEYNIDDVKTKYNILNNKTVIQYKLQNTTGLERFKNGL